MDALSENLLLYMDVRCSNPFRQILTYSINSRGFANTT